MYGSSYNIKRLSPSIVPLEIQLGRFKLRSYSRIESILFEDWNSTFVFGKKKNQANKVSKGELQESKRVLGFQIIVCFIMQNYGFHGFNSYA